MNPNIYLDIDGVLLANDNHAALHKNPEHLADFVRSFPLAIQEIT